MNLFYKKLEEFKGFSSDCESIIDKYNNTTKIDGDFAFILFDTVKNEVVLGRDHVGLCPLYYYHTSENFIASSEIKVIEKILQELTVFKNNSKFHNLNYP